MKFMSATALCAGVLSALLAGCASDVKLNDGAPVESRNTGAEGAGGAGSAASQSQVASVDLTQKPLGTGSQLERVIYFDLDSYVVKDQYRPAVEVNAKLLSSAPSARVSLEGHTDERGGREYNLALGQKRAEAVAKAMTLLGANSKQIEAVSFGKERPADPGHDEAAWAKNRRVEIRAL